MTIQINNAPATISLKAIEKSVSIDWAKMPQESLEHVFAYGIRQILNDAMAPKGTAGEKEGMAAKRLANLMSGTLRASPVREGNPVRARAMELALAKFVKHPKFIEWCQKAGIKVSHKDAVKEARRQATLWIDKEGNQFVAQAEKDVAASKGISTDDLEVDFNS